MPYILGGLTKKSNYCVSFLVECRQGASCVDNFITMLRQGEVGANNAIHASD